MALTEKLGNIGDAIRSKTGGTDLLTLDEMPGAIAAIEGGGGGGYEPPEEVFSFTGNCSQRFANNGWNWFIDMYGNRITTSNISIASNMFAKSSNLENIPFDINIQDKTDVWGIFSYCSKLSDVPYIKGMTSSISYMFRDCNKIRNIPDDFGDFIDFSYTRSYTYAQMQGLFSNCFSLRSIPQSLLGELYSTVNTTAPRNTYYGMFERCYCLDEIKNIPVQPVTATSNFFYCTFDNCSRLADVTFAVQEDGAPYTANWKSQVIDLSKYVGYANYRGYQYITYYNSGITKDKYVNTPESYNALKNDPDWFAKDSVMGVNDGHAYSRYNHDSAVNTINSLPDTSAYLATAGGTNTIKFKGEAGSATDGGAINTLTSEEIAVATAKGWTVTLV